MAHIYLDNDFLVEVTLTRPNASTGEDEAADGLTGTAFISATRGGAAIHAAMSGSLAERAGTPGTYHLTFDGADITTHLAAYAGDTVYECVQFGSDFKEYRPRLVRAVRDG